MTAYAIGLLNDLQFGPDIVTYLERIDASLQPFDGIFLVHGVRPELKEGMFDGDCVVISFPTMDKARDWYASEAYAELIPLRTRHSRSTVFFLDGVAPGYRATSLARQRERKRL
ncbi:MAG: DUF1330 domain-containing protein [Pigmentiphaga sp.]